MDHAEARERLADALLAPRDGGLESALADPSATSVDLRAHLAACAPCSRELDALRAIGALLATAAPDSLAAPPSLRERVMAALGEIDLAGPGGSGRVLIGSSSGRLVAFSSTLPALPAGLRYECFIERGGVRTWIGWMHWSADLAYWSGPVSGIPFPWRPRRRLPRT